MKRTLYTDNDFRFEMLDDGIPVRGGDTLFETLDEDTLVDDGESVTSKVEYTDADTPETKQSKFDARKTDLTTHYVDNHGATGIDFLYGSDTFSSGDKDSQTLLFRLQGASEPDTPAEEAAEPAPVPTEAEAELPAEAEIGESDLPAEDAASGRADSTVSTTSGGGSGRAGGAHDPVEPVVDPIVTPTTARSGSTAELISSDSSKTPIIFHGNPHTGSSGGTEPVTGDDILDRVVHPDTPTEEGEDGTSYTDAKDAMTKTPALDVPQVSGNSSIRLNGYDPDARGNPTRFEISGSRTSLETAVEWDGSRFVAKPGATITEEMALELIQFQTPNYFSLRPGQRSVIMQEMRDLHGDNWLNIANGIRTDSRAGSADFRKAKVTADDIDAALSDMGIDPSLRLTGEDQKEHGRDTRAATIAAAGEWLSGLDADQQWNALSNLSRSDLQTIYTMSRTEVEGTSAATDPIGSMTEILTRTGDDQAYALPGPMLDQVARIAGEVEGIQPGFEVFCEGALENAYGKNPRNAPTEPVLSDPPTDAEKVDHEKWETDNQLWHLGRQIALRQELETLDQQKATLEEERGSLRAQQAAGTTTLDDGTVISDRITAIGDELTGLAKSSRHDDIDTQLAESRDVIDLQTECDRTAARVTAGRAYLADLATDMTEGRRGAVKRKLNDNPDLRAIIGDKAELPEVDVKLTKKGREIRDENSALGKASEGLAGVKKPIEELSGLFNTGVGFYEKVIGLKKEIPMSENAKEIMTKAMDRHSEAMKAIRGKIDITAAVNENYDRERDHADADSLRTMRDKTGEERKENRAKFKPGVQAAENLKPTLENERAEREEETEDAKLQKQLFKNLGSRKRLV